MTVMKPVPWGNDENLIEVQVGFMGRKKFNPEEFSRHFLVVGGSGSGKTKSVVEPYLEAIFNHRTKEDKLYAGLVIDPKNELRGFLNLLATSYPERMVDLNHSSRSIYCFKGMEKKSVADKLEVLFNLFPSSKNDGGDNAVFRDNGLSLLRSMGKLEEDYYEKVGDSLMSQWLKLAKPKEKDTVSFFDALYQFFQAISLNQSLEGKDPVRHLMDLLASAQLDDTHEASMISEYEDKNREGKFGGKNHHESNLRQFGYYFSYLKLMFNVLTAKEFKELVDANPIEPAVNCLDIEGVFEQQQFLLFSPQLGSVVDEVVAKLLKNQFFKYSLNRRDNLAPLAYVADEFQNFISVDEVSGEHNYLDRCRGYRVSCLLATQSYDSLVQKAAVQEGRNGEIAVRGILNNTANKLFFRSVDHETESQTKKLVPKPPVAGHEHILDVRPLTSLRIGECYYLRSDGEWGREQINIAPLQAKLAHLKKLEGENNMVLAQALESELGYKVA